MEMFKLLIVRLPLKTQPIVLHLCMGVYSFINVIKSVSFCACMLKVLEGDTL